MESTKQSNKISDIVRLKHMLKKWRNQAHNAQTNTSNTDNSSSNNSNSNSSSDANTNTNTSNNINNISSNNSSGNSSSKIKSGHARKGSLSRSNSMKGISFLKRTLSFTDHPASNGIPANGFPPLDHAKSTDSCNTKSSSSKGITFLKRTLSFTDLSANTDTSSTTVRKGFLAVHVGEEMKRFVIPTNYLGHQAFSALLKDAEDEFGFQQEGVLRIPCEVEMFESILRSVEEKNRSHAKQGLKYSRNDGIVCGSVESQSMSHSQHPPSPMCR